MAETATRAKATGLVPMAHVADVQRSVDFYRLLGMELRGSLKRSDGGLQWAHIACEGAELMLTRADQPIVASQQAVLFYLYSPDLIALRQHLLTAGIRVSGISYPLTCPRAKSVSTILTAIACSSARLHEHLCKFPKGLSF